MPVKYLPAENGATARWTHMYRKVLDATAVAFAEKGYEGSTIGDIADQLKVRSASLYYYLPSKEAGLAAVCEAGVRTFIAELTEVMSQPIAAREKLKAAISVQLSPLKERPYADYIRVFLRHRHELPGDKRRQIVALSRQYQQLLQDIFSEGLENGEFRPSLNIETAAVALLGLCNSVISAHVWPRAADIDRIIDEYTSLLLVGVSDR